MSVLPVCLMCEWYLWRPEEVVKSPRTRVTDVLGCDVSAGNQTWFLLEQQMLLTTELKFFKMTTYVTFATAVSHLVNGSLFYALDCHSEGKIRTSSEHGEHRLAAVCSIHWRVLE